MQATLPRHIASYYSTLQTFDRHGAASEGAVRIAFQNLLSDAGRPHGFTVLAEQTLSLAGERTIRVDGEVRDPFRIRHGIWEAKDTGDDLETEIRRKIERGYPTRNTIFENTRRAVLYQNGVRVLEVNLTQPHELQRLLPLLRLRRAADPRVPRGGEGVPRPDSRAGGGAGRDHRAREAGEQSLLAVPAWPGSPAARLSVPPGVAASSRPRCMTRSRRRAFGASTPW